MRQQVQQFVQILFEDEVTALLDRTRSARRAAVDGPAGYRNGYGKPRRLAVQTGTITVRRPRVRGVEGRLESRMLPLFQRHTQVVGDLLPERYLHGLAQGDLELALDDGHFEYSAAATNLPPSLPALHAFVCGHRAQEKTLGEFKGELALDVVPTNHSSRGRGVKRDHRPRARRL